MNKKNFLKILFLSLLIGFMSITSGCSFIKIQTEPEAKDAGIFKSIDGGENWQQKVLIPSISGNPGSIASVNVTEIVVDPQDHQAFYLISPNGMFYTYDGAESWFKPRGLPAPGAPITALAIDPNDKCTIFMAIQNKIYKSTDCSRSWQARHLEERGGTYINSLAIDYEDSNIVYAGENKGDILKSVDGGLNWATMISFKEKLTEIKKSVSVKEILLDPNHTKTIYIVTVDHGILKSNNKGETWEDLLEKFKDFRGASKSYDLKFIPTINNGLIHTSSYGILISEDGGENWRGLTLLSKPGQVQIKSVAIDPKNAKIIYYATATAFYKSVDGGESWTTKKLISTKAATAMYVDSENTNIIYMGMTDLTPKK